MISASFEDCRPALPPNRVFVICKKCPGSSCSHFPLPSSRVGNTPMHLVAFFDMILLFSIPSAFPQRFVEDSPRWLLLLARFPSFVDGFVPLVVRRPRDQFRLSTSAPTSTRHQDIGRLTPSQGMTSPSSSPEEDLSSPLCSPGKPLE